MSWTRLLNPGYILKNKYMMIPFIKGKLLKLINYPEKVLALNNIYINANYKSILSYKDKYAGKRCFLIGNGPSLRIDDLDKLKEEFTFSANRIYLSFEKTDWRPSFYFIEDMHAMRKEENTLNERDLGPAVRFFPQHAKIWTKNVPRGLYYNLIFDAYYPNIAKFSLDPVKGLYHGGSVVYIFLQMAFFMGFKDIYIVGVDYSYGETKDREEGKGINTSDGQKDHFHPDYRKEGEVYTTPKLHLQEKAFEAAKVEASRQGRNIFNATRGGKLEIFQRIGFDELFK